MLQDYFKGASTPHQDYIKTSLRLIKSPSILTKDYLQAAKTPLKESSKTILTLLQDFLKDNVKTILNYLNTPFSILNDIPNSLKPN